ncbi:hypothetical protein GCM10009114_02180 [Aliiglaciecola litoralis]|uniref:Uncharacterized protein n=1 Tax=Aliiglaciecola litoralis TaxID=582857 RepID=A0ABN1LC68_9ALTE
MNNKLMRLLAMFLGLAFLLIGPILSLAFLDNWITFTLEVFSSVGFGILFLYYAKTGKNLGRNLLRTLLD